LYIDSEKVTAEVKGFFIISAHLRTAPAMATKSIYIIALAGGKERFLDVRPVCLSI